MNFMWTALKYIEEESRSQLRIFQGSKSTEDDVDREIQLDKAQKRAEEP